MGGDYSFIFSGGLILARGYLPPGTPQSQTMLSTLTRVELLLVSRKQLFKVKRIKIDILQEIF